MEKPWNFDGQMISLYKYFCEFNTIIKVKRITTVQAQLEMECMVFKLTKQSCTPLVLYTNKAFLIDTAQVFVCQESFMQ